MNSLEIHYYLKSNRETRKIYDNVYPADLLPKVPKRRRVLFIANHSPASSRGTHWVAFYITPTVIEFFDSSGVGLLANKYFVKFLQDTPRPQLIYNTCQVQDWLSDVCGEYCCLFALYKARNYSFGTFLKLYSEERCQLNDKTTLFLFVSNFLKHYGLHRGVFGR